MPDGDSHDWPVADCPQRHTRPRGHRSGAVGIRRGFSAFILNGPTDYVLLGAGVLHFLPALGFALWAKSRLSRPMFAASLEEFRKDQEWLTKRAKPN